MAFGKKASPVDTIDITEDGQSIEQGENIVETEKEKKSPFSFLNKKSDDLGISPYPEIMRQKPAPALLPDIVKKERLQRSFIRKGGVLLGILLAGIIGLYVALTLFVGGVNLYADSKESELVEQTTIYDSTLKPFNEYADALSASQNQATSVADGIIDYAKVTGAIEDAARGNAQVRNMSIRKNQACSGSNVWSPEQVLGCVDISGVANNPVALERFNKALEENEITMNPFSLTKTAVAGGRIDFTMTVNYGTQAYSDRYLAKIQESQGIAPVDPAPAPAPEPTQ